MENRTPNRSVAGIRRWNFVFYTILTGVFLVVGSFLFQAHRDHQRSADLVNRLGLQRACTERLVKNALLLSDRRNGVDHDRALNEFRKSLAELSDLVTLQDGSRDSELLHELTGSKRAGDNLEVVLNAVSREARQVLDLEVSSASRDARFAAATKLHGETRRLSQIQTRALASVMEGLKFQEKEREQAVTITLGLFLVAILAQGLFIFRPALRRMEGVLEQTRRLQRQVETQNDLLNERNQHLEEQRRALETQRRELAAQNEALQANEARLEEQQVELAQQNAEFNEQRTHLEHLAQSLEQAKGLQEQAARRAEELFQGVPVACFSFDADGVVHAWNRAAEKLYGYQAFQVLFQPMWSALDQPETEEESREAIRRVFDNGQETSVEWIYRHPNGEERTLVTTSFPIRNADGVVIAGIGASLDFTEQRAYERELVEQKLQLQEANARLHALAQTDGLTGLANHRTFQSALQVAYDHALANGTKLSLMLLDVDHFKRLNDNYGHPVGDKVLQCIARVLRDEAIEPLLPCRYGGEEFVVLLPGLDADAACRFAEQVRERIEGSEPDGLKVTASLGVSTLAPSITSREELVAEADRALYESKHGGRNRVSHADDSREPTLQAA